MSTREMDPPMSGSAASAAPRDLVRVLVVDDHAVVRLGLRHLFEAEPGFFVVGEAGTVAEAVAQARKWQPDVVVLDVRLPDGSGVEACREIRAERPETQVVMLSSYPDEDALVAAVVAGAAGYLLKGTEPERLVEAVGRAARGESLLDAASTRTALAWMQRQAAGGGATDPLAALSEQEKRVLPLIGQGMTNREIGAALFLSDQTIKGYVSAILKKLQLRRRAEAAAFAARHLSHLEVPGPVAASAVMPVAVPPALAATPLLIPAGAPAKPERAA